MNILSSRGLKKWALVLTYGVVLQSQSLRADQTISDNLIVTGTTDIQGSSLSLGTRSDNSNPGWLSLYTDGATSVVEFDASRSANVWKWQQNGGSSLQEQMSLDNNNNLVIYSSGSSPTAEITLNPTGTSTFANSVTLNGTNNLMPNQTLTGTGSVLTEGLGDGRYLSVSATSIALFPSATATGTNAVAMGNSVTATGNYSVALGSSTTAGGQGSFATGESSLAGGPDGFAAGYHTSSSWAGKGETTFGISTFAAGDGAFACGQGTSAQWYGFAAGINTQALGWYSAVFNLNGIASGPASSVFGDGGHATNWASAAFNYHATASGFASSAFNGSTASGDWSSSFGAANANSQWSFAVGFANLGLNSSGGSASTNTWVATDPLFEVGNGGAAGGGNPSGHASDALAIYKNGNATFYGVSNLMPNQTLTGAGSVLTEGLADSRYISSSGFSNSITLGGTNNLMPSQTLTGSGSVLTEGLADSRYISSSGFSNSVTLNGTNNQLPNQTLTGTGSVLTEGLGDGRYQLSGVPGAWTISGANTYLMGGKVGIGTTTPQGPLDVVTSGDASIHDRTTSDNSYAGLNVWDYHNNLVGSFQYGNPSVHTFSNEVVIASRRSNIPVVLYQGGTSAANKRVTLDTSGNVAINGNTSVSGAVTAQGTIRCAPGGDLAMGNFTAGTHP